MKLFTRLFPTLIATLAASSSFAETLPQTTPTDTADHSTDELSSAFSAEQPASTPPPTNFEYAPPASDSTAPAETPASEDTQAVAPAPQESQATIDEEDNQALEEFIQEEVTLPPPVKPSLRISGDTRLRYKRVREVINSVPQVGKGSGTPDNPPGIANDQWVVEANLKFNYTAEKTWGIAQLKFKNNMGENPQQNNSGGSGTITGVSLERANFGYRIWEEGPNRLIIVGGRMQMSDYFDSVTQFDSRLDGIFARYSNTFPGIGDYYIEGAMFIIDNFVDQYGWMAETSLENIVDTGWYVRYSIIDWRKYNSSRPFKSKGIVVRPIDSPEWRFIVSQFTGGYEHIFPWGQKDAELYGAFLINTAAKPQRCTKFMRQNLAWYVGYLVGQIIKQGDWAFEIIYEYVQAQAVADLDSGLGAGRGNAAGNNLYISGLQFPGNLPGRGNPDLSNGNTNYKGWDFAAIYALTDQLTVTGEYWTTRQITRSIGGRVHYNAFETKLVYSF